MPPLTTAAAVGAAIPGATVTHGWLCDAASGDLAPAFGGVTLIASGAGLIYNDPGPRTFNDRAIGFTASSSGRFTAVSGGTLFDIALNTDELVVAWVGKWLALPTAFGGMFGKATAAFGNGWEMTGTDGTSLSLALGPGSTWGPAIAGTSGYMVGAWHVGIAVIDRSGTDVSRFGVRDLVTGTTIVSSANTSINGNAASNATDFTVGSGAWVSGNDQFRLAALYIGKGPGVATGTAANLSTLLASFAAAVVALTVEEQELFDFAIGALPNWIRAHDEFLSSAATVLGMARSQASYLFSQALITQATGATATTPDWLAQHARDRGTTRQAGETDPVLQQRLRVIPDAVTRQAVLDAANAILTAAGVIGTIAMIELPRDGAWVGTYTAMTGTGGTFVQVGTTSKFTPTTLPWPTPPFRAATVFPVRGHQLIIAGAANANNNGTRPIIGLENQAALVTNATGVAGVDATVTWTVKRLDVAGNVTDGFARAFVGRGYRVAQTRPFKLLLILPYGTSIGVQNSVIESIRLKKAGGFKVIVERRVNP